MFQMKFTVILFASKDGQRVTGQNIVFTTGESSAFGKNADRF
jgi:hypothetical protein